ncbi:MAG: class I SAM-dependent methyltransferase [Burkholderiales bacterium]
MLHDLQDVLAFYSSHPISHRQVLASLASARGGLDSLRPEELFAYDQDHYGGTGAVEALAARAGIMSGTLVADFCAGLAGPARYLAHRYGANVVCIELNPDRAPGAADLTRRVGLSARVQVVRGDVMQVPLASATMDAVISQEAFLHVPDKRRAFAEAFRVLKPAGRFALTDWILHQELAPSDADLMWRGMAVQTLQSAETYRQMLHQSGFRNVQVEDLSVEWSRILEDRFAMYRQLREETHKHGTPSGNQAFYDSYARLVALIRQRVLGGGRFCAEK